MACKDKGRYKETEGKNRKNKSTEQVKITMVAFSPPYLLYPEIQPGGRKSFFTMSYFFIFITELQGKDCLSPASISDKWVSSIGYS